MRAMLRWAADGVEVLGMHTIFGPNVRIDSLRQQNIVFTKTDKSGALSDEWVSLFYKHGARVTLTEPAQHDAQMALHQNLTHLTALVLAHVLADLFPNPRDTEAYSSPNSRHALTTMGRVLSADTELLQEIQEHNPAASEIIIL